MTPCERVHPTDPEVRCVLEAGHDGAHDSGPGALRYVWLGGWR